MDKLDFDQINFEAVTREGEKGLNFKVKRETYPIGLLINSLLDFYDSRTGENSKVERSVIDINLSVYSLSSEKFPAIEVVEFRSINDFHLKFGDSKTALMFYELFKNQEKVQLNLDSLLQTKPVIANLLWDIKAVQVRTNPEDLFSVEDGKSPVYIDLRRLNLFPAVKGFIFNYAGMLVDASKLNFDLVCGGEAGGISLATDFGKMSNAPAFWIRKNYSKTSGLEGISRHEVYNKIVLLMDDVLMTGKAGTNFVNNLRKCGAIVNDYVVLVDREQGGTEVLKQLGLKVHPLLGRDHLFSLEAAPGESRYLSPDQWLEVDSYFKDSQAWHRSKGLEYKVKH